MMSMTDEERRLRQRNFYLRLSPFEGHIIAEDEAGFMSPSEEILEAEIRDTVSLWMSLQQGLAGEVIANCAWWMTQHMDPDKRLDATQGVTQLDKLTSFAVAVVGQLVDSGCVTLNEKVELPDIKLSTEKEWHPSATDFLTELDRFWREAGQVHKEEDTSEEEDDE